MKFTLGTLLNCLVALPLLCGGCSKPAVTPDRTWRSFVQELSDPSGFARLDTPGTQLITSYDRTGGNDDFNNFVAPGSTKGWVTIANLKGPGVVRRFWTTGADPGHPFNFYFDGEKTPRISGPIEMVFGGQSPFTPPLARYLNLCWFSYVPLTFQKSLRIESAAPPLHPFWGQRRLFYQINVESLPADQVVESFPARLSAEDLQAVATAQEAWQKAVTWPDISFPPSAVSVEPGSTSVVGEQTGPTVLTTWGLKVEPRDPAGVAQLNREALLQQVIVQVFYDGAEKPSVEAPLGALFGNAWRTRQYGSLALGSGTNGYVCRLPMPFKQAVRFAVRNESTLPVHVTLFTESNPAWSNNLGYLHAEWRRSGPQPGTPHTFCDIKGDGKLVGTYLGLTGLGQDWWVLEGDESCYVDGEATPRWHGTGLEDYFNGGWYYRGAAFSALHGIFDRAPFRVGQYRFHLVDALRFQSSLRMNIERGDQNVSPGIFESVSFFYLRQPAAVAALAPDPTTRQAIELTYFRQTFMLQLSELERMNNFQKAGDLCQEYLERYPDAEECGIYRLRILEYRQLLGEAVARAEYEPFLQGAHGAKAAEQAKLLVWFHEQPGRALIGLNANAATSLMLDGREVLSGDHPFQLFVTGIELGNGPHVLACKATMARQEPWVLFAIRTQDGLHGSGPGTYFSRQVSPGWEQATDLQKPWEKTLAMNCLRGTPDAPMIGGIPNAFVLLASKAFAIRSADWGYYQGTAYFRSPFTLPLAGLPSFASEVTGLTE